jgi:hypothetical protein
MFYKLVQIWLCRRVISTRKNPLVVFFDEHLLIKMLLLLDFITCILFEFYAGLFQKCALVVLEKMWRIKYVDLKIFCNSNGTLC